MRSPLRIKAEKSVILDTVRFNPGIKTSDIARLCGIPSDTVLCRLYTLERKRLVTSTWGDSRTRCWTAAK